LLACVERSSISCTHEDSGFGAGLSNVDIVIKDTLWGASSDFALNATDSCAFLDEEGKAWPFGPGNSLRKLGCRENQLLCELGDATKTAMATSLEEPRVLQMENPGFSLVEPQYLLC